MKEVLYIVAIGRNPLDLLTIKKLYIDHVAASVKKTFILFYIVKLKGDIC